MLACAAAVCSLLRRDVAGRSVADGCKARHALPVPIDSGDEILQWAGPDAPVAIQCLVDDEQFFRFAMTGCVQYSIEITLEMAIEPRCDGHGEVRVEVAVVRVCWQQDGRGLRPGGRLFTVLVPYAALPVGTGLLLNVFAYELSHLLGRRDVFPGAELFEYRLLAGIDQ